ncbi:MAG: hypothetical protein WC955_07490 [Elusimicrobiota bacterium]
MNKDLRNIGTKELAILVSTELAKHGIDAVLVGGACVSIYSRNKYISGDLDYITAVPTEKIVKALKSIGFTKKKQCREFINNNCPFFIEFPPGPVSIGNEVPITKFNKIKALKLFTPTDCVKDRLAAFYHWNDLQSLDQAIMVATAQEVNLKEIGRWSKRENALVKFKRFRELLNS